jgi:hypothetical protein
MVLLDQDAIICNLGNRPGINLLVVFISSINLAIN